MKLTQEFKLRKPRKSDLDSYYKNKNNKALDKGFFNFKYPYTKKQAKKDLENMVKNNKKKDYEVFIIDIDGEAVGEIGLTQILPKLSGKIHYWLGKKFRGRGIVTKAVKMIVDYGFKKHNLVRIFGRVRKDNKDSQKVLEKAGFKLKKTVKNKKGVDVLYWEIKK